MKKILALLIAAIMAASAIACSSAPTSGSASPAPTASSKTEPKAKEMKATALSAEDLTKKLKDAGLPIDNIIVYTEKTDTNELLGRPNQYISKTNFADTTVEQGDDKENPVGGSIETFNNDVDLKSRKDYCESLSKASPMFSQYYYVNGNYLLRIDNAVTPTDAKKYEEAFANIK